MKSQTDTKPWVRTGFSCNLGSGFNYTAEVNYSQRMGTNFKFGIKKMFLAPAEKVREAIAGKTQKSLA